MSVSGCASATYNIYIIGNSCILSNTYLCHHLRNMISRILYLFFRKEYQHSSMSGCNNGAWWWWSSSGSWNESAGDLFAKLRGSYLLHSLAFRLRREWDGDLLQKSKKKIEKPKREKDFSFLPSNEILRSAICSFKSVIQKLIDNK